MNTFWYLATPYSKYPHGIQAAFKLACENAALLVKAKVPVYSPIAATHVIALVGDIPPFDHDIWLPADAPFMRAAHGLIVLTAEGWRDSYGIGFEIRAFERMEKPIQYMMPGLVPENLLA